MPGERRKNEWKMKNWSLNGRKYWRRHFIGRLQAWGDMRGRFVGLSVPAAAGCSTPNSTAGSIARAKPVQGCTVENSGSKHGQILFAPAAEKYFMPTERMQSIAATPAGKRLTAKAGPRIKVPI